MARLESQAIKGYYPFPDHLIKFVTRWLNVHSPEHTVILDPCAGKGEAVASIGESLGIPKNNLLCAELDKARAKDCMEKDMPTIIGDALHEIHVPTCSLLWLNPPYDVCDLENCRRLETQFLGHLGQRIVRGGVLAYVVPFKILFRKEYTGFPDSYKNIRVLRFPDEDDRFGQCVVLATRLQGKTESERINWRKQLENPLNLTDSPDQLYKVPAVNDPDLGRQFYSERLTEEQIDVFCENPVLKAAHEVKVEFRDSRLKTLMPLRTGHQALVLATGAFDGVYRSPENGNTLVVLGSTKKVETEHFDQCGDSEKRIVRITPQAEVLAWDLTASTHERRPVLYKYV
jgi:hypothetical protein